ncbi:hypothetical protein N7478_012629 [Penicillium angulare]|uniref:uncharacterized protein n=1 Tax=Penicillium angulare TaxID=116970 RepID=UPI0025417C70|nr:uncharacterized protein N7478_012629 [Penicillium angulare]KAJ5256525.1 hypothetical protein N7478_012629 [Penicillium angulare]
MGKKSKLKKGAASAAHNKDLPSTTWLLPPASALSGNLRAAAVTGLKTAEQWATTAEFDAPPPPTLDELGPFLDLVISLTRRMTDDELLAELQRLRAQFDAFNKAQADI